MKLIVVALSIGAMMAVPTVAQARPSQSVECVCQTFARYMDGSKALRRTWAKAVDSKDGLRGNRQAGDAIKVRLKTLAKDGKEQAEKGCKANDFMVRVCRAYKACAVAAAGTLYIEWIQDAQDFWKAEKDALNNCVVAMAATFFAG